MAHLFVWRSKIDWQDWKYHSYESCIYCNNTIIARHKSEKFPLWDTGGTEEEIYEEWQKCPLCGWKTFYHKEYDLYEEVGYNEYYSELIIKDFDISDTKVALHELGTHLKTKFTDIYYLSPRRFEELVCDIFKRHGEVASLTKATRDKGVDIYLFKPEGGTWCIIECKKYAASRKVGVQAIDRLWGVQLSLDVKEAKLVTSSTFSKDAKERVLSSKANRYGFKMELIGADELLRLFKIYNHQLPALSKLNQKDIEEIIRVNKEEGDNLLSLELPRGVPPVLWYLYNTSEKKSS